MMYLFTQCVTLKRHHCVTLKRHHYFLNNKCKDLQVIFCTYLSCITSRVVRLSNNTHAKDFITTPPLPLPQCGKQFC